MGKVLVLHDPTSGNTATVARRVARLPRALPSSRSACAAFPFLLQEPATGSTIKVRPYDLELR
jgi:hypothetical protein